MKNTVKTLALLLICSAPSMAQTIDVPLAGKLDLGKVLQHTRGSFVLTQDTERLMGGHLPVMTLHDAAKVEYVNVNAGLIYDLDGGVGGPFIALGIRGDNIARKINSYKAIKKHVSAIVLPPMEVGPFIGFINKKGFRYGLFVAMYFGGDVK